jgi:Family of unknown function (DUF6111)
MLRVLLEYLLPLLLPFLLWLAYVALTRSTAPGWVRDAPWPQLAGAGLVLAAISLVTWSLLSGAPPEEAYIPPHLENGEIVPGTTVAR